MSQGQKADGYSIDIGAAKRLAQITLLQKEPRRVLAHLTLDADKMYDMAHNLLAAYDKLEGIK